MSFSKTWNRFYFCFKSEYFSNLKYFMYFYADLEGLLAQTETPEK